MLCSRRFYPETHTGLPVYRSTPMQGRQQGYMYSCKLGMRNINKIKIENQNKKSCWNSKIIVQNFIILKFSFSHTPQACSGRRVLGLYQGVRNSSLSQQDNILLPSSLAEPPPAKSLLLHCHLVFCCKSNPSRRPIHKAARFPYEAVVPPPDLSKDPGSDLYE